MYKDESEINYSSEQNPCLNNPEYFDEAEQMPFPGPAMPGSYQMPCQGGMTLARSYVAYQQMGTVFTPAEAHKHATLFPELVRPYP